MKKDDSGYIRRWLDAASCDVTPVSERAVASVLFVPISSGSNVSSRCATVLSDAELLRAQRFTAECDRSQFLQRRAFRRYCAAKALGLSGSLSQLNFEETRKGRPYCPADPQMWFSFSSCRLGLFGAWSTSHRIGVDLEDHTGNIEAVDLARHYFSQAETITVENSRGAERQRLFYQYWSLKEAALKSIGEGMPFGLDRFGFALSPEPRVLHAPPESGGPSQFKAHFVEAHGISGALVLHSSKIGQINGLS